MQIPLPGLGGEARSTPVSTRLPGEADAGSSVARTLRTCRWCPGRSKHMGDSCLSPSSLCIWPPGPAREWPCASWCLGLSTPVLDPSNAFARSEPWRPTRNSLLPMATTTAPRERVGLKPPSGTRWSWRPSRPPSRSERPGSGLQRPGIETWIYALRLSDNGTTRDCSCCDITSSHSAFATTFSNTN